MAKRKPKNIVAQYKGIIKACKTWPELERVVYSLDRAFLAGALDDASFETLIDQIKQRATQAEEPNG